MHNSYGWSDWSSISTGGMKVKGLPDSFQLKKTEVTENTITLNVIESYAEASDASCTNTDYHVLDQKVPGGSW